MWACDMQIAAAGCEDFMGRMILFFGYILWLHEISGGSVGGLAGPCQHNTLQVKRASPAQQPQARHQLMPQSGTLEILANPPKPEREQSVLFR